MSSEEDSLIDESPVDESSIELSPRSDYMLRFKIIRQQYRGVYEIPSNVDTLPLDEVETIYQELMEKIGTDRKTKWIDNIKEICRLLGSPYPEELDDPEYINKATAEEIQELCKDRGIDMERNARMCEIIGTVAIASGCYIQ